MATGPLHAVIAGAGPAGALLAYLLARRGVRVTLIERHTDFSREFRGEGMSPAGMGAIREAGLWEEFNRLPSTKLKSVSVYAGQRPFLELDLDQILPPDIQLIRILSQVHLLEMLVEKAAAFPGFTLLRGAVVADALLTEGRVTRVHVSESGVERDIAADYVFAADGRFSVLRKRLGLELGGKSQEFDVVWCKVPRPDSVPLGRVFSFIMDPFFGLIFPTEADHLQIGRIIPKGAYRQVRTEGTGDWYDKILGALPERLQPAFETVRDRASEPALLDVICGSLDKWSGPGLAFIGDAAHPMSPIGAQGLNIALRDAVIAANHFGPKLLAGADGAALDAAAVDFEAERRVEVDQIQAQQNAAPAALSRGRTMAPLLRVIPSGWIAALGRFALGRRAIRNLIEGAATVKLTFR